MENPNFTKMSPDYKKSYRKMIEQDRAEKGEDVVILPAVKDEEAKTIYPDGWETVKPYLRKVPDPTK